MQGSRDLERALAREKAEQKGREDRDRDKARQAEERQIWSFCMQHSVERGLSIWQRHQTGKNPYCRLRCFCFLMPYCRE